MIKIEISEEEFDLLTEAILCLRVQVLARATEDEEERLAIIRCGDALKGLYDHLTSSQNRREDKNESLRSYQPCRS